VVGIEVPYRRWQAAGVRAEVAGDRSWLFDLVASDDAVRHRALDLHQELLAAASAAHRRWNQAWLRAGMAATAEPELAVEMDQQWADFRRHEQQTIFGPVSAYIRSTATGIAQRRGARYAALYLRWEAAHPDEWGAPGSSMWSPWGTKERLLRKLDRGGVPLGVRSEISDLIVAALQRPYRCKDWMYARLVRHVADAAFLHRIETLHDDGHPLVGRRAQFILHISRHPSRPVTRGTWQRWLRSNGVTDPCASPP
jgi:hypothetical protein